MDSFVHGVLFFAILAGIAFFKMCMMVNKAVPGRNSVEKFVNGAKIGEQLGNFLRR